MKHQVLRALAQLGVATASDDVVIFSGSQTTPLGAPAQNLISPSSSQVRSPPPRAKSRHLLGRSDYPVRCVISVVWGEFPSIFKNT